MKLLRVTACSPLGVLDKGRVRSWLTQPAAFAKVAVVLWLCAMSPAGAADDVDPRTLGPLGRPDTGVSPQQCPDDPVTDMKDLDAARQQVFDRLKDVEDFYQRRWVEIEAGRQHAQRMVEQAQADLSRLATQSGVSPDLAEKIGKASDIIAFSDKELEKQNSDEAALNQLKAQVYAKPAAGPKDPTREAFENIYRKEMDAIVARRKELLQSIDLVGAQRSRLRAEARVPSDSLEKIEEARNELKVSEADLARADGDMAALNTLKGQEQAKATAALKDIDERATIRRQVEKQLASLPCEFRDRFRRDFTAHGPSRRDGIGTEKLTPIIPDSALRDAPPGDTPPTPITTLPPGIPTSEQIENLRGVIDACKTVTDEKDLSILLAIRNRIDLIESIFDNEYAEAKANVDKAKAIYDAVQGQNVVDIYKHSPPESPMARDQDLSRYRDRPVPRSNAPLDPLVTQAAAQLRDATNYLAGAEARKAKLASIIANARACVDQSITVVRLQQRITDSGPNVGPPGSEPRTRVAGRPPQTSGGNDSGGGDGLPPIGNDPPPGAAPPGPIAGLPPQPPGPATTPPAAGAPGAPGTPPPAKGPVQMICVTQSNGVSCDTTNLEPICRTPSGGRVSCSRCGDALNPCTQLINTTGTLLCPPHPKTLDECKEARCTSTGGNYDCKPTGAPPAAPAPVAMRPSPLLPPPALPGAKTKSDSSGLLPPPALPHAASRPEPKTVQQQRPRTRTRTGGGGQGPSYDPPPDVDWEGLGRELGRALGGGDSGGDDEGHHH